MGARVDSEPSMRPLSAGWTRCRRKSRSADSLAPRRRLRSQWVCSRINAAKKYPGRRAAGGVGGFAALEQEAAGAGAQCREDVLVELEGRQDQYARVAERAVGCDLARRLESVHLGHPDVHDHDVGTQGADLLERLRSRCGLAD